VSRSDTVSTKPSFSKVKTLHNKQYVFSSSKPLLTICFLLIKISITMASESSTHKTKLEKKTCLSFLSSFTRSQIVYPTQGISHYYPSCHMMDYIVHAMNITLCDNFDFKRANPNYHPYILRLYCGVLFWIQCLRAGNEVNDLTDVQHRFLNRFLDNHPLESLAVPGPLLGLFKTLCSSEPEFPHIVDSVNHQFLHQQ